MSYQKFSREIMIQRFYKDFRRVLINYVNCKIEEIMMDLEPDIDRNYPLVDEMIERTNRISKKHKISTRTKELINFGGRVAVLNRSYIN